MAGKKRAKLRKVNVRLPFGIGEAEWEVDDSQRGAAWELYVELITRIAVVPLAAQEGLLREALTSLHTLFGVTREVLRKAGPGVGASPHSVGGIAVAVLNKGIRPFLAKWHPELSTWEMTRDATTSPKDHELRWDKIAQVRENLTTLQAELAVYAKALAIIAGVV